MPIADTKLFSNQKKLKALDFENFFLNGDFLGQPSLDSSIESASDNLKSIKEKIKN